MNTPDTHPDTELLDRLRAGLLEGDSHRAELEAHLRQCKRCRQRVDWQAILQSSVPATPDIAQRLDAAREQALRAARRTPATRRLVPLAVAASAALLAILLANPLQQTQGPEPQHSAAANDVPELYEELDFYLWLADHKTVNEDSAS